MVTMAEGNRWINDSATVSTTTVTLAEAAIAEAVGLGELQHGISEAVDEVYRQMQASVEAAVTAMRTADPELGGVLFIHRGATKHPESFTVDYAVGLDPSVQHGEIHYRDERTGALTQFRLPKATRP